MPAWSASFSVRLFSLALPGDLSSYKNSCPVGLVAAFLLKTCHEGLPAAPFRFDVHYFFHSFCRFILEGYRQIVLSIRGDPRSKFTDFDRRSNHQRHGRAPHRAVRQNMGVSLCTPLVCLDGALPFNECVHFQVAHLLAGAARSVRVTLGQRRRVLRAADCAKGVRAKFRLSVARSGQRIFLNFDLTPFAFPLAISNGGSSCFFGSDYIRRKRATAARKPPQRATTYLPHTTSARDKKYTSQQAVMECVCDEKSGERRGDHLKMTTEPVACFRKIFAAQIPPSPQSDQGRADISKSYKTLQESKLCPQYFRGLQPHLA